MCRAEKWFFSWLGVYMIGSIVDLYFNLFGQSVLANIFLVGISLPLITPYLHGYIFRGDKE